ncbi:MAG: selenite/tellurite reduction operon rhodanese-like protein ExtH [Deltaproteobacteria bacterium]|jgi:thiosulfate/3-mercaptopyruvate sulfurtransferase
MLRQPKRKTSVHLFLVLALALMFQGCGDGGVSSYDTPSTTSTGVVVDAATVKNWVDNGNVNGTGYDKVVILDIGTSSAGYATGHIPGAQYVSWSSLIENRDGGVLMDVNMVISGPAMDALIQQYGIDKNTTVVFTSAMSTATSISAYYFVGRAYWTFRYWGFPKDRLKVLNGLDAAYADQYGLTDAASPAITPSTYSVQQNPSFRGDLRASLGDMIDIADGNVPNAVVMDTRGEDGDGYNTTSSYSGDPMKTSGVWTKGTYVVFEGHINGGIALNAKFFFETVTGTTQTYQVFLPASDMAALLAANGVDSTQKVVVHCRTGVIASGVFVAIDSVLGWSVANWDGSWSQWGILSGSAENCGPLDPSSPWRTDINGRTQNLTYNHPADGLPDCSGIEDPTNGGTYPVNSFDTDLNKINEQDNAYFSAGGSSDSGGGGGGGGNIGC